MSKEQNKIWREALRKAERQLATMTDEEDAEIRAGIARDPDAFEITDEMWSRARPAIDVMPEIVEAFRRRRGPQKAPTKEQISIRLDHDVIAYFRDRGDGWQRRINAALRRVARLGPKPGGKARAASVTKSSRARQRPRRGR